MNKKMENERIKVAVVAGGWSGEREVSLSSGKGMLEALQNEGFYAACLIDVHKDLWRFAEDLKKAAPDVVIVATHGVGGEDGVLQGVLEMSGIPYTHSGVTASALAMDKVLSRIIFERIGIQTPDWKTVTQQSLLENDPPFTFPYVVKPVNEGSSLGVFIIHNQEDLIQAMKNWPYGKVLVERYIVGREVQSAVLNGRAIGAIEIKPHHEFFDYRAKYTKGEAEHIMPASMPASDYQRVLNDSESAYRVLGCRGVVRLDFMYDQNANLYLLELNNLPGMTAISLVPEIARHGGMSYTQLIHAMIEDAMQQVL